MIRLRVLSLIVATVFTLTSCTVEENKPPEEDATSAVLSQVSEGPKDPPELLVSGSVLFPIEFYWVSRGQLRTADAPPTSEGIRSVKRTEGVDELLIRMNEAVSPYHTLVRECERINDTATVELEGCTYLEYGAQFRVDWKRENSGLELVVPVTEKSKYVTVTIQYPNANGWDRTAEGNPVNHANYAFVLTDN